MANEDGTPLHCCRLPSVVDVVVPFLVFVGGGPNIFFISFFFLSIGRRTENCTASCNSLLVHRHRCFVFLCWRGGWRVVAVCGSTWPRVVNAQIETKVAVVVSIVVRVISVFISTMKWWHLSNRENEFERPAVASVLPARLPPTTNAHQMAGHSNGRRRSGSSSSSSRRPKCCSCCLRLVAVLKRKFPSYLGFISLAWIDVNPVSSHSIIETKKKKKKNHFP